MLFRQIFDDKLAQYAYLIGCQRSGEALIVDPERDIDRYLDAARREGLTIVAVAETHIHADFLSGAREFAEHDPSIRLYLSDEGDENWKYEWARDARYTTTLVRDGDTFEVGRIRLEVRHTPGHTPEHVVFVLTDAGGSAEEPMGVLSGDFVFVGDLGRPDLLETAAGVPGDREPSARRLYASARDILEWPEYLQVWPAHGAGSACGKALGAVPQSTIGYEVRHSPALAAARESERAFVDFILDGQPEPPLYFARMKRLNKEGAPVLGDLPRPPRLDVAAFEGALAGDGTVVLDTRDREAFIASHAPGALLATLDRSFPTIAGSYVKPEASIVLVVDPARVEEAVRDLIRIGLDRIAGWLPDDEIASLTERVATPTAGFDRVLEVSTDGQRVLDVRGRSEYASGHVDGALQIAHTRLASRLDELPRDRELLVHCRSGARAAAATALLEREGFRATLIDAPFSDWKTPVTDA